ncbi:SAM-dependent methyltransferase [Cryptosporangium sp. NPDC051539]|uniref:SAM-dependent methyltransferase n=1 Tax=Cryptosporangium sp. NPDC051539 TaxID=3363962 RepID=UPI0037A55004
MVYRAPADVQAWLAGLPSLDELRAEYPSEWEAVAREVGEAAADGELTSYAAALRRRSRDARLEVRRQMAVGLLRQLAMSAATGVTSGRVRFNLLNGWVAQKLLFSSGLTRKPVSLPLFRLVWPLVWQKRLLMPLVQKKGIYCFYSRELISGLADLIDGRPCLEIAAGDGTLSRLLRSAGVPVTATDDHSWSQVSFGDSVERLDAARALRRYQPSVVLCSWPPAGNPFERAVFTTESVQLYVVISSKHEHAAGDWAAYRKQRGFSWVLDPALSGLVLPPELDSAVYVFRRD